MTAITLNNECKIELLSNGPHFTGLGSIFQSGTPIRGCASPMFVDIRTPEGVQIVDYTLQSCTQSDGTYLLEFAMSAQSGGPMDWMLHEVRPRLNTRAWGEKPERLASSSLKLEIKPVVRQFGSISALGFSYQYHYQSDCHKIYKIIDRSSWEVGGFAEGNEFWLRNSFAPSIYPISSCTQRYSSEWYVPSAMNSSIFQFLPWQTQLEGFSLTCHERGNLITWTPQVTHIRSLFEKHGGHNEIAHWHEHCGDLSAQFSTAPVEVLWVNGGLDCVGRLNLYHDVRETVAEALHSQIGMRRERVCSYGVIEEWGPVDMVRYRERGESALARAGVKTIMLANHFENNMNVYGVGNMCCTIDYKVADSVGEQNLADFCAAAAKDDISVQMWGNTALSTFGLKAWDKSHSTEHLLPLPAEGSVIEMLGLASDPFVRNPAGHQESDHYAPVFAQLNLRDETVRNYWLSAWKHAHQEIGLAGIFLDSSFNLSSDKFHWVANVSAQHGAGATADQQDLLGFGRPEVEPEKLIHSQYLAHLTLMKQMQDLGYVYCGEDIGTFGIHRAGPSIQDQLRSMPLWSDCLGEFHPQALIELGANSDDIFFQGMAYRLVWRLSWDIDKDELTWHQGGRRNDLDAPTEWQLSILRAFNNVENGMRQRRILSNEAGVLYTDGATKVVWAFDNFEFPLIEPSRITEIISGEECIVKAAFNAESKRIYRIEPL